MANITLTNSIWPNGIQKDSEGYACFYPLGTNKTPIPTSSSEWPKGNRLVSPFVYQDDKLVGFCDTRALTTDSQTTIYLPYTHIEAEFSAIEKGQLQIHAPNATTKKASWKDSGVREDIPEVQFKYKGCKTVDDVKIVDANYQTTDIVNGVWSEPLWDLENCEAGFVGGMFFGCETLTSFTSDLSSLTDGRNMFGICSNLTLFNADLSSMTNGGSMFAQCPALTSFSSDLSNLTYGSDMFNGCSSLASFSSDLSSLTDGDNMFYQCTALTSFNSDLSSLTNGEGMFSKCKLDAPSVKNIIDTINTYSGKLTLGMGCNSGADANLFIQEVGYNDIESFVAAIQATKWQFSFQFSGRPTTTYSLRKPSENALPVFVKIEEVEDHADYTSLDDSKKFRLNWFHMTTGSTEGYTQFASLEEAVAHYNIKPIERN